MASLVITDEPRLEALFERGRVAEVLPSLATWRERLGSGDRLRIYLGLDPTAEALHLGHAQNLLFLEDLRRLGHEVIVLLGDFTARIGDPSGRASTRPRLSPETVAENSRRWLSQIKPWLDFGDADNPPRLASNRDWLEKLSMAELLDLAAEFTVQQMLERDMFARRLAAGESVSLVEFLYPLFQGYDSVALDVDVELCATDQIFNALAGRTLQKRYRQKDKFVVALELIANPKTGELMSKSHGRGVFLNSSASEMFGAMMAQPDEYTEIFFRACTRLPLGDWSTIAARGPRAAKAYVAQAIVTTCHGAEAAAAAAAEFEKTFSGGGIPDSVPEVVLAGRDLPTALVAAGLIVSKTEWRRLVAEGAVCLAENGEKVNDPDFQPSSRTILKIGKRRFVRII